MSFNLKQTIEKQHEISNKLSEVEQTKRGTYSLSIGIIKTINQDKKEAEVFLPDHNKTVKALIIQNVNTRLILGKLSINNLVVLLHIGTHSPYILMKLDDERLLTTRTNADSRNMSGVSTSYAGGSMSLT